MHEKDLESMKTVKHDICAGLKIVVVVVNLPLPRDRDTARTAIPIHAVNLIEIRLGERLQPILNQS